MPELIPGGFAYPGVLHMQGVSPKAGKSWDSPPATLEDSDPTTESIPYQAARTFSRIDLLWTLLSYSPLSRPPTIST